MQIELSKYMFKELRPLRVNIHQAHLFGGVCERSPACAILNMFLFFNAPKCIEMLCLSLIRLAKQFFKKLKQYRFSEKVLSKTMKT